MNEYEIELCIKLISYSFWSCEKTKNKKLYEIREYIENFFDKEIIDEAMERLTVK